MSAEAEFVGGALDGTLRTVPASKDGRPSSHAVAVGPGDGALIRHVYQLYPSPRETGPLWQYALVRVDQVEVG